MAASLKLLDDLFDALHIDKDEAEADCFSNISDDVIQSIIGSFLLPTTKCIISRVSRQFHALFNMEDNHSFEQSKDVDKAYWDAHFAKYYSCWRRSGEMRLKYELLEDKELRSQLAYFLIYVIQYPKICPFNGHNFQISVACTDQDTEYDFDLIINLLVNILHFSDEKRSVQTVSFYNVEMVDDDILNIINALKTRDKPSNIRSLNLVNNQYLTGKYMPQLFDVIGEKCSKLEILVIEGNDIKTIDTCNYIYNEFYPKYHKSSRLRRIYLTTNEDVVRDPPAMYDDYDEEKGKEETEFNGMLELRSYCSMHNSQAETGWYVQRCCEWDMASFKWDSDAFE